MIKLDESALAKSPIKDGVISPPEVREYVTADVRCWLGKEKDHKEIEMFPSLVPNWQEKAIEKMGELLDTNKALRVYMDSCVRCGSCADKCQYFLGTGDPRNMPVARAGLFRSVYLRYFNPGGKFLRFLSDARDFDMEMLTLWYIYFYQCSECRRCSVYCPYGIDTAEITMAAREIMASIGVGTKYVTEVVAKVYQTGNNLGIPPLAWIDNCEFLEEDMEEILGVPIRFPVNEEGAEILLIPPSADNFANVGTFIGYAILFHKLGISWTTSTYSDEAGNFGLFLNHRNLQKVNRRMVDAARMLKVKTLLWGECGHAWRAGILTRTMNGAMDFLDPPYPYHISQFTMDMIRQGRLTPDMIDKEANDEYVVTYHDPCNPARAGQLLDEPREILNFCCNHFYEMPPNTIREHTYCCGSGGGLLTDEIMEVRMGGGKPRAEAVRHVVEKHGVNTLSTICAICKAGLPEAMKYWKVPVEVVGVVELLGNSLMKFK